MVAFDNTIFCLALHSAARPPGNVERAKERVEHLLGTIKQRGDWILIPAPVLAEFLVFAGADGPAYVAALRENSLFRVFPFDEKAAIENADVELVARSSGDKRGSATGAEWQKVKVDRQILSIARTNGAACVYSDDPHVVRLGKDFSIQILGVADLPLPPATQLQLELQEKTKAELTVIPGAGDGPTEGQA